MTPPTSKEATFVALLDKHQNIIHKICSMYTKGEAAHNDLFQEISIQLWKSYDHFQGKSKFSTWMYRVGLNTSITLFRKEKKRVNTEELQEDITRLNEIDYDPEIDDQLTWLYKKIEHFSEIDKALTLLYLEDKKYDEIAATLGISSGNARVKMNRIKQRLRELLKKERNG